MSRSSTCVHTALVLVAQCSAKHKEGRCTDMAQDRYQIRVKGHLGMEWSAWFDGLAITNVEQGEAILSGIIVDQAALFGVLLKIRDLGLPLLAVNQIEPYRDGLQAAQ